MVERPIKKSERQSQASTDNNSENTDSITPIESNPKSSKPSRNRSSGTDKKASYGNETRQQGNPALARGPKPVKPPVKVETEELETESETISEESQD
ncbi:hypothetical protein CDG77_21235 [Nostoc sp. 'Peltigera membranacea cyanobiont' 213]|uniref:hypothetical protein n=1 Tax=unclassified Nostoc TaxID=2593658 RepID=UPI000B955734|nr:MULTISPECIES: hypothetical protein [unclassified Nostoc]AVH66372.1 hypothetical protein NPM_4903 [Nostoc sp. 'Peltigera membranacea cyanobiont' N6]OYD88886.1 hypothetical protein CDG77_21235 [Nostoc sp. 'Peltigera membranacea cyanobiont' 213]